MHTGMRACKCVCVFVQACVQVCVFIWTVFCQIHFSNDFLLELFFQSDLANPVLKRRKYNCRVHILSVLGDWGIFLGVGVVRFLSKFQIQSRMILVNTLPNPNLLTQSVGKLSHRENPFFFEEVFWVLWGCGGFKAEWYQ